MTRLSESVVAVVPTHNSRQWIDGCLSSVYAQRAVDVDVVVVDNASSDGTAEHVRSRWPKARVIALDQNVGYGASVNIGAGATPSGSVMALNADAELEPNCLIRLSETIETDTGVGVAAPKLVEADGRLQPSAHRFPTIGRLFAESVGLDRLPIVGPRLDYHCRRYGYDRPMSVDWATGAALLISREAWLLTDGFDGRYFMYAEEIDFQHRVRQAGLRVVLTPSAVTVHHGGNRPLAPSRFLLAHAGLVRFLARGTRWRAVSVEAALGLTALTRSITWFMAGILLPRRRPEARSWGNMFLHVFLGSLAAIPRLVLSRGERTTRPCYICGTRNNRVVAVETPVEGRQGRPLMPEGVYRFARCRSCGTLYVDSDVTDEYLATIYGDETPHTSAEASGIPHEALVAGRSPEFEHHWRRITNLRAPCYGDKLIDVGCQTGDFGEIARRDGVAPSGVELSSEYADISRRQWGDGAIVHCGPLDTAPFQSGSHAYVTAFETLEHVCDPIGMLVKMKEWGCADAVFAVSVPASDYFYGKYWLLTKSPVARLLRPWLLRRSSFYRTQVLPHTHIYNFTDRSVRAMLERAGLRPVAIEPVGWQGRAWGVPGPVSKALFRVTRGRIALAPSFLALAVKAR